MDDDKEDIGKRMEECARAYLRGMKRLNQVMSIAKVDQLTELESALENFAHIQTNLLLLQREWESASKVDLAAHRVLRGIFTDIKTEEHTFDTFLNSVLNRVVRMKNLMNTAILSHSVLRQKLFSGTVGQQDEQETNENIVAFIPPEKP
jgi:hypothetical protein